MKLVISHPFILETEEGQVYKGLFRDLSKKETKELNKTAKKSVDLSNKARVLMKKIDDNKELSRLSEQTGDSESALEYNKTRIALEDELSLTIDSANDIDAEPVFKKRLDSSIVSEHKDEIFKLGEQFGYELIFNTIQKDIQDNKGKS